MPAELPRQLDFAKMFHGHDERMPVDVFFWGTEVLRDLVRDFRADRASEPTP